MRHRKIFFYNLEFIDNFSTKEIEFKQVANPQELQEVLKYSSMITYKGEVKYLTILEQPSLILGEQETRLDDYCLLLSLVSSKFVFTNKNKWLLHNFNSQRPPLDFMLTKEVENFLEQSLDNLEQMDESERGIFREALLLTLYSDHKIYFNDMQRILLMNCFEFLIKSLCEYYYPHRVKSSGDIEFSGALKSILDDYFGYPKYLKETLKKRINGQRNINESDYNLNSYFDQFREMRNWVNHGRWSQKPYFPDSPSDLQFTFFYRLGALIRIMLIDYVYDMEHYERKFDILYQLVLEHNVTPTLTPDTLN